jgi:hypothetical protein
MLNSGYLTEYTKIAICEVWNGKPIEEIYMLKLVEANIQKAIYKFCARDLGIV